MTGVYHCLVKPSELVPFGHEERFSGKRESIHNADTGIMPRRLGVSVD